jgi:hypothetical protein
MEDRYYAQIDKLNKKILALESRRKIVELEMAAMSGFMRQYKDRISGPDAIFGVLADETIVNILQFLPAKQILLGAPCMRFHVLREEALRLLAWPKLEPYKMHIDNLTQYVFSSRDLLYYHMCPSIFNKMFQNNRSFRFDCISVGIRVSVYSETVDKYVSYTCQDNGIFSIDIGMAMSDARIIKHSINNNIICISLEKYRIFINKNLDVSFEDKLNHPLKLADMTCLANKNIHKKMINGYASGLKLIYNQHA